MPVKSCLVCNKDISLSRNPTGLVFEDKFFICESCCTKHSEDEILNISKSFMQNPDNGMPIALWLIHEQNKDKTMMTIKK